MIVQLNLLPDIKEKYLRTQFVKRMVFGGALVAVLISVLVVGLLSSIVYGAQKVKLNNLDKTIKASTKTIAETEDLDKILTIQNQLNSLTPLHDSKAVTSRLFEYLPQITPNDVSLSNITVNFDGTNTITISGVSKSLEATNRFVDTLKFTKYTTEGSEAQNNAFSSVVLSSFGRSVKESTFTINMVYDPALFDSQSKDIKIIVPKQITTQSTTQRPSALFKQPEVGAE
jgi:Tfp pilus assembly protein PilN